MIRRTWSRVIAAVLCGLVLPAGVTMMGACGATGPGTPAPDVVPDAGPSEPSDAGPSAVPDAGPSEPPIECPVTVEDPCMRYHIPLAGNPSTDVALRNKYIAAFGSACYMSEVGTFDCFYQKWQAACADAAKIGLVSGNAPYDQGYACKPDGAGNYTLQIGPDVANKIVINYQAAPRQTPLTEVNGVPTAVNGPYRNLVDPAQVGPGNKFDRPSGMVDADGGALDQQKWVLQVNRNAHPGPDGGTIHSDLAGFTWTCPGADGGPTTCIEPDVLEDPASDGGSPFYADTVAQVHHVVPMKDKRCCPWGTNAYKNAAVISGKLNRFLTNNNPPAAEVSTLNNAQAYTP